MAMDTFEVIGKLGPDDNPPTASPSQIPPLPPTDPTPTPPVKPTPLPHTGSDAMGLAGLAAGILLTGLLLLLAAKRRRREEAETA
jgi:LPXTG-motif cell wall-anchored protein